MKNLYSVLNKISNIFCTILSIIAVCIVVVNAGSVFLQVINRYIIVKFTSLSFPWTDEMARYSMIWLCYVILPIVYREGAMAQLDLIFDRLGKKGKLFLYIVTRILCLVFIVLAVKFGLSIIQARMIYKSPIMHAPGYLLFSAPVFGSILTGFEILTETIGVLAGELQPFYAGQRRQFHFFEKKGGKES